MLRIVRLSFMLTFLILSITSFAQKYTISGYVKEAATGEDLIGANVYVKEISKGATTNNYGFYSLTLEKGEYTLIVSFIGNNDFAKTIKLDKNIKLNISLEESSIVTQEVVVTGERTDKNVTSSRMSAIQMEVEAIKEMPAFMGEVDILKSIQLLPGVQSSGEGNSGFYVRGGGPDQNLILLDEATVYNASHLFGFFSVFNADAIKDVNLIKGGMPANYGGRLSSVLDISMKDGNSKQYEVDGGIGLIASRLTIQGPIKKDTSSFIISGRRTYIDVLTKPFISKSSVLYGTGYYFYDLNAKVNYKFTDKDRLYLSGYFGRDVLNYNNSKSDFKMNTPWGNTTATLRWNHLFTDKLFLNTTLIYSDYYFEFNSESEDYEMKLFSGITDYHFKVDFTYIPTIRHNIKYGIDYIYHTFIPTSFSAKMGDTDYNFDNAINEHAHDAALYINDDFDVTEKIKLNIGLRATYFEQVGPFKRYIKDDNGVNIDTLNYAKGDNIVDYKHLEPRASAKYSISKTSSIKVAYTQNYQYVHMVSASSISLPTDLWVPSSTLIKPQFATQYALGYFRNFKDNKYETSLELYYKKMEGQIEYKDGAMPGDNVGDNADNSFTFGDSWSYGAEVFLKKAIGRFNGFVGYTWSKTERKFEELNKNKVYPAKYDRRHDLSVVLTYDLTERWTISGVFVYATGNCITLPEGRYMVDGQIISEYGEKNSFRMDPYHRMDLSATYKTKKKKNQKYETTWNFSIYNLYNRKNPYFIYFSYEGTIEEGTFTTKATQVSLFPVLPSITWNFKF